MARKRLNEASVIAIGFLLAFSVVALVVVPQDVRAYNISRVWTDGRAYSPESQVTIYGSNFAANSGVTIVVTHSNITLATWVLQANRAGAFTTTYQLDALAGTYYITATDDSDNTATTAFVDAPACEPVNSCTLSISPTSGPVGTVITLLTSSNGYVGGQVYGYCFASDPVSNKCLTTPATFTATLTGNIPSGVNLAVPGGATSMQYVNVCEETNCNGNIPADASYTVTPSQTTTTTVTSTVTTTESATTTETYVTTVTEPGTTLTSTVTSVSPTTMTTTYITTMTQQGTTVTSTVTSTQSTTATETHVTTITQPGTTVTSTVTSTESTTVTNFSPTTTTETYVTTVTQPGTTVTSTVTSTESTTLTDISATTTTATYVTTETQPGTTVTSTVTNVSPTTTTATYLTTVTQPGATLTSTVTNVNPVTTTATHVTTITQPGATVTSTVILTQSTIAGSSTTSTTSFPPPPSTPLTVACDHTPSSALGVRIRCEVEVESASGSAPTGSVTWSVGSSGKFWGSARPSTTCKLVTHVSFSACSVLFTPMAAGSPVVLTVKYAGDSNNAPSAGTYNLTVLPKPTKTTVSCSPRSAVAGSATKITCKAKATGYSPTGTISWSQTGTGSVSFSSTTCTLTKGSCSVKMTGSIIGSVNITASYSGDSNNQGSSGIATLTIK